MLHCITNSFIGGMLSIFMQTKSERSGIETNTNKQVKHKPKSNYSDSLEITGPTAVFYYPDSIQLKTIQSITDPQILDGTLHELQFQIKYSKK